MPAIIHRADQNKENEVGNHYVAYIQEQRKIVKNFVDEEVSMDATSEAEPIDKQRSAKPRRFKNFRDILESEDDIPSPSYSPHRSRKRTPAVLKIKNGIAEGKQTKKSQAQKAIRKKKHLGTILDKENCG